MNGTMPSPTEVLRAALQLLQDRIEVAIIATSSARDGYSDTVRHAVSAAESVRLAAMRAHACPSLSTQLARVHVSLREALHLRTPALREALHAVRAVAVESRD